MRYDDHNARLTRASDALEGLSTGDSFGERFFLPPDVLDVFLGARTLPAPPWRWTDDTAMALSVFDVLAQFGEVDRDALAARFAARYVVDPARGYGRGAHQVLAEIAAGQSWEIASEALFDGSGSYGNGGAMRVAPVGAYFADDLATAAAQGIASAVPTHSHREGRAGAASVSVAAAFAFSSRGGGFDRGSFFEQVLRHTPSGEVWSNVALARDTSPDSTVAQAVGRLGNGGQVIAQDTVGFALWCAARHIDDFEEAMWSTVSGLGDRDTTCAIVGGIVASRVGAAAIPAQWRAARERLPQ